MNINGQGHSLTLHQSHSESIFLNFFSSITTRPFEAKFHMEPPLDGGTKACSNGPGHMTKMAAMPIYGKNLKKSSLELPAPIAQLVECPLREREVTGSIPGRDIPKSLKMVLAAPRLALRFMG